MRPGPWGKRGETGVGTSIIFVALVLVSSAASSVVIDSMNSSGDQAVQTVNDALQGVSSGLEVRSVVGLAEPSSSSINGLEVVVSLIPGSSPLNLTDLVIEVVLDDSHSILTYGNETGYSAQAIQPINENRSMLEQGELFILQVPLPKAVGCDRSILVRLVPSVGITCTIELTVPDTITSSYVLLR